MIFSKANCGTFSTSLAIQGCGAATGILTARLLGPVARGELATVILWPTILSNLGLMGCNWVVAREVAKDPEKESDWIVAGAAIGLATAFLYFAAGYFLLPVLLPSDRLYLLPVARLCLLLLPLDIINQMLLAVEHGRMRWRRYNFLRLSYFLFYLGLIGLIAFTRREQIRWFAAAFLASQLLSLLLRLWVHRKSLAVAKLAVRQYAYLIRQGVPFFGATISNLISLQLDTILVVGMFNAEAAGIYAVASAFANGQSSLGEALGITSFAVLSNEKNPKNREKIITETFRQSTLISLGAGIALACLIPILVGPLLGFAFSKAIRPAVLLALSASVMGSANILNQGLRGAGRPHAGLVSQLTGAGVMGLTAFFFLRGFGLMGMASAVGIGACVQLLVLIIAAAEWLKISQFSFGRLELEISDFFFSKWLICVCAIRDFRHEIFTELDEMFMSRILGYITPVRAFSSDGKIYMQSASGKVAEALSEEFEKVYMCARVVHDAPLEPFDHPLNASNIELIEQPYWNSTAGSLLHLFGITRAYVRTCLRADVLFVRGMSPFIALLYLCAWLFRRPICHWIVGDPVAYCEPA